MSHNADRLGLFTVVAAVHHERVGETLNDGALGLAEALRGIAAGRVREVDGLTDLDVVAVFRRQDRVSKLCPSARYIFRISAKRSVFNRSRSQENELEHRSNVRQRHVPNLNVLVCPLVEELDASNLGSDLPGHRQDTAGELDLDFPVVGHIDAVYTWRKGCTVDKRVLMRVVEQVGRSHQRLLSSANLEVGSLRSVVGDLGQFAGEANQNPRMWLTQACHVSSRTSKSTSTP